jgi:hypothetical protein
MPARTKNGSRVEPLLSQNSNAIQKFGTVRHRVPVATGENVRQKSVENLNLRKIAKRSRFRFPVCSKRNEIILEEARKFAEEASDEIQVWSFRSMSSTCPLVKAD